MNGEDLHRGANECLVGRGVRSGRMARQFIQALAGWLGKRLAQRPAAALPATSERDYFSLISSSVAFFNRSPI